MDKPIGRPLAKYAVLIPIEEFKDNVGSGFFTDYDGSGRYSDGKLVYEHVDLYSIDNSYSHVEWHNK